MGTSVKGWGQFRPSTPRQVARGARSGRHNGAEPSCYNHYNPPIYSFIIHFSFAIVFALLYCIAAEYFPKIKLWQGAAFGLLVWIGAHVVFMPLLGWVPSPFPWVEGGQTWSEHFSEALGHVVWLWSIEIVRRDLRRITRQPDPEVPLEQPYR